MAPEPASSTSESPQPPPAKETAGEVRLGDTVVFVILTRSGDQGAAERAVAATKALKSAAVDAAPEDVHVERAGEFAIVYVGPVPIVQLTTADATAAGDASLDVHADVVAGKVRKAIRAEKERSALASRIFSISLVVFFGMVVLYLLRRIGHLTERANEWVDDNPHRIPAIRVRTLTLLTPVAFRSALALGIGVARWFGQFAIVYVWIIAALGLFETTRGYTQKMNGYLLEPFVALTARVVTALPITVVVLISALVVALVFRVVSLFFESVREGTTVLEWMPVDLARPTSSLVRIGIVLGTLVFAAPVLTGHQEGALARAGLVFLITIGLASVPLVANGVVGVIAIFGRRFTVGDRVSIGDTRGLLREISLVELILETRDGVVTRVPHLVSMFRPTEIDRGRERVAVRIETERWRFDDVLRERLLAAIAVLGSHPSVKVVALDVERVGLELAADAGDAAEARGDALRDQLFSAAIDVLSSPVEVSAHEVAVEPTDAPPSSAPEAP
ncbi:MAG: mechanosensitive ion channel family protein [Polyangiaceae bacterium]